MAQFRVESTTGGVYDRASPLEKPVYRDSLGPGHTGPIHEGVDIRSSDGNREVRAPARLRVVRLVDGTDPKASEKRKNAGPWYLHARELDASGSPGFWLRFLHLEKPTMTITPGEVINRGTVLALYDKTYNHVHFEVRKPGPDDDTYGAPVEPKEWISGKAVPTGQVRLVALLGEDAAYKGVKLGDTLYAESGHRMVITAKPGFPYLTARAEDPGEPMGKATSDIGEAAEWTLAAALDDTKYNFQRDGILHLNAWAYRVRGKRDEIEKARALPPAERWARAWQIRKDIAGIRGEGFIASQTGAAKAAAQTGANAVASGARAAGDALKQGAADIGQGLWDSIPSWAKAAGAAAGLAFVVKTVTKDD